MNIRTLAAAAFAALSLGGAAWAQPTDGLIGQPLAAAQHSDLFTFFNLAQTAGQACGAGQALGFRPTGGRFHALAAVEVITDARGAVTAMALVLDRAFVDSASDGVFARDIAGSFLRDVAGSRSLALAGEIKSNLPAGAVVIGAPPAASGPTSPCGQVFLGHGAACVLTSDRETVTLTDGRPHGDAVVWLSVYAPGGMPSACVMRRVAG